MNNIWNLRQSDSADVQLIHSQAGVSLITAHLLVQRGIKNAEDAHYFLNGGWDELIDPWQMQGMYAAVERIKKAIEGRERVILFGDYDVDGVCSIVILQECLQIMGCRVDYRVADRFKHGYGLNNEIVRELASQGYQLLITVDCGISSVEETELAHSLGMDVIITDHHIPAAIQPSAQAVINPKNDGIKRIANLAGAGVVFKLATALADNRIAREKIEEWLELVALATVADIVPLLDENRLLVKYGLQFMAQSKRVGLAALIEAVGLAGQPIQSWQIAYLLAPPLNSAGRLDTARISIELLLCADKQLAREQALKLCQLNNQRRQIEDSIYREAREQIESILTPTGEPILIVGGDGWHEGVIGIVASRLAAVYNRPTIVICWSGDVGKASARSVGQFDIFKALNHVGDCLLRFGGHKMAAGLTINRNQLGELKKQLREYAQGQILLMGKYQCYVADVEVEEEHLQEHLLNEIDRLAPFGEGNPVPRLVLRGSAIQDPYRVGVDQAHLKFSVGEHGLQGIAFNQPRENDHLMHYRQDLLFELTRNNYRGQTSLQLKVKDFKPVFIPDRSHENNSNFMELTMSINKTIQELAAGRPVIFVYPAYRSLLKHQAVMEYCLGHSIQILHGHLPRGDRNKAQEQLNQGIAKVYLVTGAFLNYYRQKFRLPGNLRYMVQMWPVEARQEGETAEHIDLAVIKPASHFRLCINPSLGGNPKPRLVYANLPRTIRQINHQFPIVHTESGLDNMKQRRSIRRKYRAANEGILLSDGTHTAGWGHELGVSEITLADSPLGLYELTAFTDYLQAGRTLEIGVAFNQADLKYNRSYLGGLYPDQRVVQEVMAYLQNRSGSGGIKMAGLLEDFNRHAKNECTGLEMRSALRILADLGLCRFQKSGSIMPINHVDIEVVLDNMSHTPYYLEGMAEQQVLDDWEKRLMKELEW